MTVVAITQSWQRNKLLDFTRNKSNNQHLQEEILKIFGKYQDKGQNMKEIRAQPRISLWDRTTGIPLKVSMNVMEQWGTTFHTLITKEGGEYLIWCHFLPDEGKMVLYMSTKHIADHAALEQTWISKFEELLNQSSRGRGKGKGGEHSNTHRD